MSLWPWPLLLGQSHQGISSPRLQGQRRQAWLPLGLVVAVMSGHPSPAGRSQRRRASSAPGEQIVKYSAGVLVTLVVFTESAHMGTSLIPLDHQTFCGNSDIGSDISGLKTFCVHMVEKNLIMTVCRI